MRDIPSSPPNPIERRLALLVRLARAADVWERLWRGLVPPLVVAGVFVCLSWLGLWLEVPRWGRAVGVALFALAFVASCWRLREVGLLSRASALRRVDRASGVAHRPAAMLADTLASSGHDDPATAALWALHRRRTEAAAASLRAGLPSPRAQELDRYALRAAVLVGLIACALVAGPQRYARVAAAFDFGGDASGGPGYRLDAWIDPPPYTGKPPVLLDLAAAASRDMAHPPSVSAPAGSVVIVRSSGGMPADVEATGPLLPPPAAKPKDGADVAADGAPPALAAPPGVGQGGSETRLVLHGDSQLVLRHAGDLRGVFNLVAVPDMPPTITLSKVPKFNARGSMTLTYETSDDYGVSRAEATFASPKLDGEPVEGTPLVPAPKAELALPGASGGIGEGETTVDLTESPWAGATVTMTLVAHDEGGNEGRSTPVEMTLPQKPFTNPLARALVEQRRNLVLNPGARAQVGAALDALMADPEAVGTTTAVYLGLRFASDSLAHAESDKDLVAVADFLWGMAQFLENGDLSEAEKALRQAEKDLRDAIDRHASSEEIQKLTQNLQAAMDKFLKELAEQQQKQPQQAQNQGRASKTVSQRDLQALIDRLKEQARSGNREEAKKALDELQDILENLKTAKRQQQSDPQARAMAEGLNQLDQMMRDQQELRDQTYKKGQQGQGQPQQQSDADQQGGESPSQNGMPRGGQMQGGRSGRQPQNGPGQQGAGQMGQGQDGGLEQKQRELRDRLAELQKKLKQAGEGQGALDDAAEAMRQAEDALKQGEGSNGQAVDAQGRALDKLRQGAKKLADEMGKQGDPNGQANGEQEGSQGSQQGQQSEDADPLGRPRGGSNTLNSSSRFNPLGIPAAQRAQRVLEELRRRLADPLRSQEEIDYLERLLHSY